MIVMGAGAGAAGLTAAGGCAIYGLRAALIERGAMGGDCLNTGCVPSKALIAAAAAAHAARGGRFGIAATESRVDFAAVRRHVRGAIARIAPNDSRERFEALGVEVIAGAARFVDRRSVAVGGRRLSAPRIVIATGSRPAVPDVPGLADAPYVTNETIWNLDRLPRHLAILGGGAIGTEMAQAFRRLGAEVTLIERGRCLSREDEPAATVVLRRLREEGVRIIEGEGVAHVRREGAEIALALGWPAKVDFHALPRVACTDPELAQMGETEAEARARGGLVTVRSEPFAGDDRAVCEAETAGFVKTVWAGRRPVGATIIGARAGDMLLPWSLLIRGKGAAFALAGTIVAYPTRSERSKAAAFAAYEPLIFSPAAKAWARRLAWMRRRA